MYQLENYENINFFTRDEIKMVNTQELEELGYKKILSSLKYTTSKNVTDYYYNPNKEYVYIQCYFSDLRSYTQLIVSRDIIDKVGVIKKDSNVINIGKGGKLYVRNRENLERVFVPKSVNYISTYIKSNIIDSKAIFYMSDKVYEEGIVFPKCAKRGIKIIPTKNIYGAWTYRLEIIDKINVTAIPEIKNEGFIVRKYEADYFRLIKYVNTEEAAWIAYNNYCDKFYKYMKPNIFNEYLSENFEIAYRALILGELSEDDVKKLVLYNMRMDWHKIAELNLHNLYVRYGIPHIEVNTDSKGRMVMNSSNYDIVKEYKLL